MIRTRKAFLQVVGDLPSGIQVRLHLRYADYAASKPFLKTMDPDMVSLEGGQAGPGFPAGPCRTFPEDRSRCL